MILHDIILDFLYTSAAAYTFVAIFHHWRQTDPAEAGRERRIGAYRIAGELELLLDRMVVWGELAKPLPYWYRLTANQWLKMTRAQEGATHEPVRDHC